MIAAGVSGSGTVGPTATDDEHRRAELDTRRHVDVVIPVYRPGRWLEPCLDSVLASTDTRVEVYVVDDLPGDPAVHAAVATRPGIHLIVPPRNLRYAAAVNLGIAAGSAGLVLLLNQDAMVDPGTIARLADWLDGDPALGVVGCRVLHRDAPDRPPDGRLDSVGIEMRAGRRSVDIAQGERDGPHWAGRRLVFGVCAAVALYRRSALARAARRGEIMDTRFVMHKEDVDLAWRLQRLGYAAGVDGDVIAYHARGTARASDEQLPPHAALLDRGRAILAQERAKSRTVRDVAWRNHLLLLIKNDTVRGMRRHLPAIVELQLGYLATGLLLDPFGTLRSRLGAIGPLVAAIRERRSWPPGRVRDVQPWLK